MPIVYVWTIELELVLYGKLYITRIRASYTWQYVKRNTLLRFYGISHACANSGAQAVFPSPGLGTRLARAIRFKIADRSMDPPIDQTLRKIDRSIDSHTIDRPAAPPYVYAYTYVRRTLLRPTHAQMRRRPRGDFWSCRPWLQKGPPLFPVRPSGRPGKRNRKKRCLH